MNLLEKDGFLIINNFLSINEAKKYLELIKINIDKAADELKVTTNDYLSCTGRWSTKSKITKTISSILEGRIKNYLENLLKSKITCKKSNVICKTSNLTDPIPFHQDISYSEKDPYHFSLWLSFNDVDTNSAPLQIIENSHRKKIERAVDFWSPYFIDKHNVNDSNVRSVLVNAGDAVVFNSKIWHGSDKNHSHKIDSHMLQDGL